MVCSRCGTKMRVQNTRPTERGTREREYKCPKCGEKLYTVERSN